MGPGDVLAERYELEERIGSGGAAVVWRAHDRLLDRTVAVKLLHPQHERDEENVIRFRREARAAAALNHRNAVATYDIGTQGDDAFIVMEHVDGPGLDQLLRRGSLDPAVVTALGHQIASALGAAHERGLIHRDIKPANVLLSSSGQAKLADFGIAKAIDAEHTTLTQAGTMVGTVAYLAPEQIRHDPVDRRADVYALGLVLYEALAGETPFGRGTPAEVAARRLTDDPPPLGERRPGLPDQLVAVVTTATRPDPDARFEDGTELAHALERLLDADPDRLVRTLLDENPAEDEREATRVLTAITPDEAETVAIPLGAEDDTGAQDEGGDEPAGAAAVPPATSDADTPLRDDHDEQGEEGDDGAEADGRPGRATDAWRSVAALATGILAVVAVVWIVGGNGGSSGDGDGAARLLTAASARDFDPFGDGEEHREDAPRAHDGDPSTAWVTETYDSADLGGLKPGVGLWFDLGEPSRLGRIELTVSPGIDLKVRVAGAPPEGTDEAGWGTHVATVEDADAELALEVPADAGGRYVLVWITSVGGAGQRAEIAEARFVGR